MQQEQYVQNHMQLEGWVYFDIQVQKKGKRKVIPVLN
jgi:hypothetical protein